MTHPLPPAAPAPEGQLPLRSLPRSARTVYGLLQGTGPLTQKDILRETGMPERTVRYALGRLKEAGIVGARCSLMDCRQCFFYVSDQCAGNPQQPGLPLRLRGS